MCCDAIQNIWKPHEHPIRSGQQSELDVANQKSSLQMWPHKKWSGLRPHSSQQRCWKIRFIGGRGLIVNVDDFQGLGFLAAIPSIDLFQNFDGFRFVALAQDEFRALGQEEEGGEAEQTRQGTHNDIQSPRFVYNIEHRNRKLPTLIYHKPSVKRHKYCDYPVDERRIHNGG